ncbi:MAG: hypothetical protein IKW12_04285 [Clostridia bacterium]|nr:hypothetical protein [Clostridia bacterium]
MKKYFALILTFVLILTCFAACKPSIKDGTLVTEFGGKNHAAVTEADGGIKRDEAGNIIVLETDSNGKNVKDENGNYVTNPVGIDHALVIGNTIEMPEYSVQIPNGWSNSVSFENLVISRDGTADTLTISVIGDKSVADVIKERSTVINMTTSTYENVVTESKGVNVGEKEANLLSAFVPDANGAQVYLCYIIFEHAGNVYSCMLNSNTDISSTVPEVLEILGTINFVR